MRFCMPDLNDAPDLDATVPVAGPAPSADDTPRLTVNLPLPEDLAKLLPEGTYTVQSFLGQGGMGAVYRGTQVRLQRRRAVEQAVACVSGHRGGPSRPALDESG